MLSFTRKVEYALVALATLAESDDGGPLSAKQIAARYDLPVPMVMNVLKQLNRAGIVSSIRGARGGYVLADDPAHFTLLEVVEAVEGAMGLTGCCRDFGLSVDTGGDNGHDRREGNGKTNGSSASDCHLRNRCPISFSMGRLHERMVGLFSEMSLADMFTSPDEVTVPLGHSYDSGAEAD
jgi:Rrf2 family protein